MALAEGVTAGNQGHGFLVVHGHAGEGNANVARRTHRVAVGVGAFGVHVNQRLVRGTQRVFEVVVRIAVAAAPPLVAHHHAVERGHVLGVPHLGAPVGGVVGLPGIMAAAGETVGGKAHDFQRAVAGQHDEVGPGEGAAVLLLNGPDEPARLVGVAIVPPAVDGREAHQRLPGAAPAVGDAVGAGGVPGHPNHLRAVVTVIRWPPSD